MNKKRLFTNAMAALIQRILDACILFILYRFIINKIGIEKFGIWSLVLATVSLGSLLQTGVSTSIVKFVAKYIALKQDKTAAALIQTATLSVAIFIGAILLCIYPIAAWVLKLIVPTQNYSDAFSLLPFALFSLWLFFIGFVFQSSLEGHQLIAESKIINVITSVFYLIISFLLVPAYGLIGLAYSQVLQASLFLLGNWTFLKWNMPILPFIPLQWNKKLFKEILGYGLNLQVISICDMLLDPITKAFATKFGGLAIAGYYDLASRMLLHMREFINQANRTLIPALVDLHENNPDYVVEIYKDSYKLNFFLIIPFFFFVIACAPLISLLWLGHYEHYLVLFSIIVTFGWLINMISMPAQIVYIATGKLKWVTIASIVMIISMFIIGYSLGIFYGGIGVVISWSLSRTIESIIIIIAYHFKNYSLFRQLQRDNIYIIITAIIFVCILILFLPFLCDQQLSPIQISGIAIIIYAGAMFLPLWKHPIRTRLVNYFGSNFLDTRFKQ